MPKLAKLSMVAALRPVIEHLEGNMRDAAWLGYLNGYEAGRRASGKRSKPPAVSDAALDVVAERLSADGPHFAGLLDQIEATLAASARTTRDGLHRFAEDRLGLSGDVLFDAWGHHSRTAIAAHADIMDAAEADADDLALFSRVRDLAWRKHGLLDKNAEPDDELREAVRSAGWDS